jgi:SNF2 family DNA or RNA helicase
MKAGDKVRLKSEPSRIGALTGEEQVRGGRRRLEVSFFDGTDQFCLEDALETVSRDAKNPYVLFRQGRYGRLRDLRGALTYYRLSGKLANLIYSMDTTNTEFYAYQFKPVLAFLESPNHGILIADEVGLGKTIEAGLIWTELRSRFDARRLLVICPAILREKWQTELSERFGVSADICSAKDLLEIIQRHRRGDLSDFAVITSFQGIRPPRKWDDDDESAKGGSAELARLFNELESEDPLFDLTIIDEAHYLRNPESQTAKLASLIRPLTDGLVMLSATPIQLKSEDLYHQVKYLDEVTFEYEYSFNLVLESSRPLIELRDRILRGQANKESLVSMLQQAERYPGLKGSRQIQHLLANIPDQFVFGNHDLRAELAESIDRINPLSHVITRTRKRDVHERRVVREPHAIRVLMSPEEEKFYWNVTNRVRAYCMSYDLSEGFLLTIPQRQMTSSMPAACRAWLKKARVQVDDEFLFEGLAVDEETIVKQPNLGPLTLELIAIAKEVGDYKTLREQDTKYSLLLEQLRVYWARYPDNKVILFSFYRETLAYLFERLTEENISAIVLQGGMDKHRAILKFKDPDGPRILWHLRLPVKVSICNSVVY